MSAVELVDVASTVLDIKRDFSVTPRERNPGPPERVDGMTFGVVTMGGASPHAGEMHPDGDEILYVMSGSLRLTYDASDTPLDVGPGQAGIVRKGQWHKVDCVQETHFIYITPGPGGEARF